MLSRFTKKAPPPAAPARAPAGRRIYAVGDVHGRADLLEALLARIAADAQDCAARPLLIFLGDYVDRGLHSRRVIELLGALSPDAFELVFLRGNHERAMLDFLERPEAGAKWLRIGGGQTLASYGVACPDQDAEPAALAATARALAAALPAAHLDFLKALQTHARHGDYLFVHAGLRPGKTLEEQSEDDLLTIRKAFVDSRARWPFVVVHGHSPVASGFRDERRIAIDTAAYATGKLCAVRLEGEAVEFITT